MIDPVAIKLGPVPIHWYGIIIMIAFILGSALAYYQASKSNVDPEHIINMLILIIPAAIIGARLYYVLFNWESYSLNPIEIFSTWHGGLAFHGGLIGGFLAGYFYVRKKKLNPWKLGDILAPGIILGQAIGRWGNFINQEAFGGPVGAEFIGRFPYFIQKQMLIDGQYHHPTFLYESAWNFLVLAFLIFYRGRKIFTGQLFLLYLAFYSTGRFFIEGLRTDSLMLGPFRVAQIVSALLIITAGAIIYRKARRVYR